MHVRLRPSWSYESGQVLFHAPRKLLSTRSEYDRQGHTRNRCNTDGYESVGLIPLRSGGTTFGLLQLNDRSPGRFTPELLAFLESAADQVAIAFAQRRAEHRL